MMSTSTTNKRITEDPVKVTIVERLVKEGHISLDEGLILLHEETTVINYYTPTDVWKPLIPPPDQKPYWISQITGDGPIDLKSPKVQEYILHNAVNAKIPG